MIPPTLTPTTISETIAYILRPMTTTREHLIDAIAEALANGLVYGAHDRQPATAVLNPMFRPHGYPPHIADAICANNRAIATAIVAIVEQHCTLTPIEPKPEPAQ